MKLQSAKNKLDSNPSASSDNLDAETAVDSGLNAVESERFLERNIQVARNKVSHPPRFVSLTDTQARHIRGWGPEFVARVNLVAPGFAAWLQAWPSDVAIPFWEDCSGAHAAVWAARELKLVSKTVAACDCAGGPQKFAFRNLDIGVYYPNLFTRDHDAPIPAPPTGPGQVVNTAYSNVCSSFSMLLHFAQPDMCQV